MPDNHCSSSSGHSSAFPVASVTGLPWKTAGPSFVVRFPVGKNCATLAGLVDEVAVVLFETRGSLAYDETDLPPDLPDLDLSFHVHLPLDTDWSRPEQAWSEQARLLDMTAYLSPACYVLHPPPDELMAALLPFLAERFADKGVEPGRVLLENIGGRDPLAAWGLAGELGFGACLDLGHVQAYSQQALLAAEGLWDRVAMLHVSAPREGDRHASLEHLDQEGRNLLRLALERMRPGATLTLEIFDLDGLTRSLDLVRRWWEEWA